MANKSLFQTTIGKLLPKADVVNEAGGAAYAFTAKHTLAQYAATGCFNRTFYAGGDEQLARVLELCSEVDAGFIARCAVYARERGKMKDVPALLCAVLSNRDREVFAQVFPRVIDSGKMLRNFVQIMRSGVTGRKSLGTAPKRLVREWFDARDVESLFAASVGQSPSFADILKMTHPKPQDSVREAFYGYLIGREYDANALPQLVKDYEAFKAGASVEVPRVPFQMLTALPLSTKEWTEIARTASWTMTRMNLNTFARHGVYEVEGMTELIAKRLRDAELIKRANVFPYQLMTAYTAAGDNIPSQIKAALQDALEIATGNVPAIEGKVYVCPDVSGSMSSPVTGYRQGSTTAVRCIDVAALVAATVLRQNSTAEVIPFEQDVVKVNLNPRDSVMTNAEKLASIGGGGTNCSAPLALLNKQQAKGDFVIYVSDNESWVDTSPHRIGLDATATMREWSIFKARNSSARMVCIDVQPYAHTQATEREDILNIGGFSDAVFDVVTEFSRGTLTSNHWVATIEAVNL